MSASDEPNPVADLIETKGGPVAFAEKIGTTPEEVRVWRSRKKLPRARWYQIIEAFPDIDSTVLKRVHGKAA